MCDASFGKCDYRKWQKQVSDSDTCWRNGVTHLSEELQHLLLRVSHGAGLEDVAAPLLVARGGWAEDKETEEGRLELLGHLPQELTERTTYNNNNNNDNNCNNIIMGWAVIMSGYATHVIKMRCLWKTFTLFLLRIRIKHI